MARSSSSRSILVVPSAARQVASHQLLAAARKTHLVDALQEAIKLVSMRSVREELTQLVPEDVQQLLATAAIRDEFVFPSTAILEARPTLLGYYRLLLGVSQKRFYGKGSGMGFFKSMETSGALSNAQRARLKDCCAAIASEMTELIRQIAPTLSGRDLNDLPLLTFAAQLYGSNNNAIGRKATVDVFLAVAEIVRGHSPVQTDRRIEFTNASGRKVTILLGSDPDISVIEEFGSEKRRKVAIEIKGGSDRSNAHNRAGEAEKSHQKANRVGFRDFWTLIAKEGIEKALAAESPTTRSWFEVTEVLARKGDDWIEFRSRLCGELGIPVPSDLAPGSSA